MQLAVQLYTVRDSMAKDVRGTLRDLADLGLKWAELAGTSGLSSAEFATVLGEVGLRGCSAHVGLAELESDFDGVVSLVKDIGASHAAVPWIDIAAHSDAAAFGAQLGGYADRLAASGIELAYHNHAFELEMEAPLWLDQLFDSSPKLNAQLDLGWVQVAGQDPVDYIHRYGSRLPTAHLKDFSGDRVKHDAIAGEGWLDWDSILPACEAAGVKFGIIEMDVPPGDPVEAVGRCVEFFREKGVSF